MRNAEIIRSFLEAEYKYSFVGVYLDNTEFGMLLSEWVKSNIFFEKFKEPFENDFHITIKYGIHTNKVSEVEKVIRKYKKETIICTLQELDIFTHEDQDVLIVKIKSKDMKDLNKILSDNLEVTDTYPIYKPHMTLAYLNKGEGKLYRGRSCFKGTKLIFDAVTFANHLGNPQIIQLSNNSQIPKDII